MNKLCQDCPLEGSFCPVIDCPGLEDTENQDDDDTEPVSTESESVNPEPTT